jgi:hypothetical protein
MYKFSVIHFNMELSGRLYLTQDTTGISSHNSFLVEVDFNQDISDSLRHQIDLRYNRSEINKTYKFPRYGPNLSVKITKSNPKSKAFINKKNYSLESKKNRSLTPHENSFICSGKIKSYLKNEFSNSSKTPLSTKNLSKQINFIRLPELNKLPIEIRKSYKNYGLLRRKF